MKSWQGLLSACGLLFSLVAQAELPAKSYSQGEFKYATGPTPVFVAERHVPESWPAQAGAHSGNWRNWMIDSQLDRTHPVLVGYSDRAFEALTSEMLGEAARFEVSFNPLYQKLTLHRVQVRRGGVWADRFDAGQVSLARRESDFENDMADGAVTALLMLSDVRLGDVVRIAYSIEGENPVIASSEVDTFHLAWTDPILERHVRVLHAPQVRVDVRPLGAGAKVQRRTIDGRQEIELLASQVPAFPDEGAYPNWYQRFPMLQVAPARSWAEVVSWALPMYPRVDSLPAELQARVAEWKTIPDASARAFAVLRTVQREVRYFGIEMGDSTHKPAPPAQTWQRRYGDCKDKAYLVSTLLQAVGVDAVPALVSNQWGRAVSGQLPAAADFDHVIVRVRMDGKSWWLDPTLAEQRGDLRTLDVRDYGVALPIVAGTTALEMVVSPENVDNSVSVVEAYSPSEGGGSVELRVATTYTGMRAESMRWQINSQGVDNVGRTYADFYRKRFSELDVAEPLRVEDPVDADRLVIHEHYSLADAWAVRSGPERSLDVYPDALASDASLPPTAARSAPLALSHPAHLSHRIVVALPKGWSAPEPPPAASVTSAAFRYQRTASKGEGKFEVEHRFDLLADHLAPDEVGKYVRDIKQVRDDLDLRLSFRMTDARADTERNERLQRLLRDAKDKNKEATP